LSEQVSGFTNIDIIVRGEEQKSIINIRIIESNFKFIVLPKRMLSGRTYEGKAEVNLVEEPE
jgi:hypothetical protein